MSGAKTHSYMGYGFKIPIDEVETIFSYLINNFTDEEHEYYFEGLTKRYNHDNPYTVETIDYDVDQHVEECYGSTADFIQFYVLENSKKPSGEQDPQHPDEDSYLYSHVYGWKQEEGVIVFIWRTRQTLSGLQHLDKKVSLESATEDEYSALLTVQERMGVNYGIEDKYWIWEEGA